MTITISCVKGCVALVLLAACKCVAGQAPIYASPGDQVNITLKIPETEIRMLYFYMNNAEGQRAAAVYLLLQPTFKASVAPEFSTILTTAADEASRIVNITILSFEERFVGMLSCFISPDTLETLEKCGQNIKLQGDATTTQTNMKTTMMVDFNTTTTITTPPKERTAISKPAKACGIIPSLNSIFLIIMSVTGLVFFE